MEKVHTYDADASEKYVCPNGGEIKIEVRVRGPALRDRQ